MGYNEFKNKMLLYYGSFDNTKAKLPLIKSALDRAVGHELPSRDDKQLFQIRDFTNSEGLLINICAGNLMCSYSDDKDKLFVGTLGPLWSRGWREVSKDPYIAEQIKDFFHFANQYIYRSSQINLIGAIALAYGRCCDFRGDYLSEVVLPEREAVYNDFYIRIPTIITNHTKAVLHYLAIINSLDPFVNKAIYYYTRALTLRELGLDEESVTCSDNMVDTIFQAIKQRLGLPTMHRKDMNNIVEQEISISKSLTKKLDSLYQLRCHFSAHPAQSKWWDFSEIYEDDINAIMDSVKTILVKFCIYERSHCKIQPNPEKWSEWFFQYSDILFDAVWFHLLPPLE
jgi:hypothetical protein